MQNAPADALPLIRAAQAGDAAAFTSLIEAHYDLMYRFACKYSGSTTDAEDITQQACMKLARSIGQFRFESAFTTWLYRLVVNCAMDWYRSKPDTVVATLTENEPAGLAHHDSGDHMILLQQVLQQVDSLGEGFREAVTLVLGEGFSHREAAEILGVKESTISWRIHETRKRLKQEADL
jgi:RNA polymerase sigma-70 factor (ECF subfamily)